MKVNTMIIGAGRSGTTSVYEYLRQHPEIQFSITKEIHYFSIPELYQRGEKYFHSLFPVSGRKIKATADTYLLMDSEAPQRIRDYNPQMKFIVVLREPVARAYSNYNYSMNFGHEKNGIHFLDTISLEPQRLEIKSIVDRNNLCHFYGGLYYKHLLHWMNFFPKHHFILLKTDDLKDPQSAMNMVFQFLNINSIQISIIEKQNQAAGAKNKWLQQVLLNRNHWLRRLTRFIFKPFRNLIIRSGLIERVYKMNKTSIQLSPLSQEDKRVANDYFKEDAQMLEREFGIRF